MTETNKAKINNPDTTHLTGPHIDWIRYVLDTPLPDIDRIPLDLIEGVHTYFESANIPRGHLELVEFCDAEEIMSDYLQYRRGAMGGIVKDALRYIVSNTEHTKCELIFDGNVYYLCDPNKREWIINHDRVEIDRLHRFGLTEEHIKAIHGVLNQPSFQTIDQLSEDLREGVHQFLESIDVSIIDVETGDFYDLPRVVDYYIDAYPHDESIVNTAVDYIRATRGCDIIRITFDGIDYYFYNYLGRRSNTPGMEYE